MPEREYSAGTGYRYGYQGSEKDKEATGLNQAHFTTYFREGDTRLARWWSVDPKENDQPWQGPYNLMDNNPVKNIDPLGDWVPGVNSSGDITLKKEKGDNQRSLRKFLGGKNGMFSKKEIKDIYKSMDKKSETITLPETNFSISLKTAITEGRPTMEDVDANPSKRTHLESLGRNYNCWGAAVSGSKGQDISGAGPGKGVGISKPETFDAILLHDAKPTSRKKAILGKTIIRYSPTGDGSFGGTSHGSVYFGRDRQGNEYSYTKNGWYVAPTIQKISDIEKIGPYGPITPLTEHGKSGFYNIKK